MLWPIFSFGLPITGPRSTELQRNSSVRLWQFFKVSTLEGLLYWILTLS